MIFMEELIKYKVSVIMFCEITAWISTFLMFLAIYKWKSRAGFYVFGGYALVIGWVPHISIVIYNLWNNQKISIFDVSIISLLIFGLVFGKGIMAKIEEKVKKKYRVKEKR